MRKFCLWDKVDVIVSGNPGASCKVAISNLKLHFQKRKREREKKTERKKRHTDNSVIIKLPNYLLCNVPHFIIIRLSATIRWKLFICWEISSVVRPFLLCLFDLCMHCDWIYEQVLHNLYFLNSITFAKLEFSCFPFLSVSLSLAKKKRKKKNKSIFISKL